MKPLIRWLMNNKLFVIFCVLISVCLSLLVTVTEDLLDNRTNLVGIELINTEPPQDKILLIVNKREFDHRYELERYWEDDRMVYLERVFLPHRVLAVFAEKYNRTASPLEIQQRRIAEQRRAGLTDREWRQRLEENGISEKELENIMREKVIVEKFLDLMNVNISDEEIASFYRAYLKDIPGWGDSEASPDEIAHLATRYKKLLTVAGGNLVGTYQKTIFLIQSPYLCRKSS